MTEYLDADGDPLFFHPGTPDEQKQAVAAQHARQRSIRADIERRIRALATEAPQETVETVRFLLHQCAQAPALAKFYEGVFASAIVCRFGTGGITIDPTLIGKQGVPGVDDAFAGLADVLPPVQLAAEHPSEPTLPSPEPADDGPPPGVHPALLAAGGDVGGDEMAPDPTAPAEPEPTDFRGLCARYRVRPNEGTSNATDGPVTCVQCGLEYVNLADRMVKEPDDCHGCIQKAKWG